MRNEYSFFEVQLTDEMLALMTPVHARELYNSNNSQETIHIPLFPTSAVITAIYLIYDKKRSMKSPGRAHLTDQFMIIRLFTRESI